jgi:hypothetical protein
MLAMNPAAVQPLASHEGVNSFPQKLDHGLFTFFESTIQLADGVRNK